MREEPFKPMTSWRRSHSAALVVLALAGCPQGTPTATTAHKSGTPVARSVSGSPSHDPVSVPMVSPAAPGVSPSPGSSPLVLPSPTLPSPSPVGVLNGGNIASTYGNGIASTYGNGLVSVADAGVVSNNGGRLIGQVKVPSGLIGQVKNASELTGQVKSDGIISDLGSGIISDQGSNLIGQTKNRRLLAAPNEVPGANALVFLLDGAGHFVVNAQNRMVATVADSQGHYEFKGIQLQHNMLVAVDLGDKGILQAIVPRTFPSVIAPNPASSGDEQVDIATVSTLTTTYILNQYVLPQAHPGQVLDKLPADVEATTRTKAAAALAAGAIALPDSLVARPVVETVNNLRRGDGDFNGQMETVRKLLVAAGQSNLGDGQPATSTSLSGIRALAVGLDGTLFIDCFFDRRIWNLGGDGLLRTAVGKARPLDQFGFDPKLAPIDGLKGPDAEFLPIRGMAFDNLQRLLILEFSTDFVGMFNDPDVEVDAGGAARVSRLEADGTMTTLWDASATGKAVAPGPNDEVWVVTGGINDIPATLVAIKQDKTREVRHTFDAATSKTIQATMAFGHDPQGRIYLGTREGTDPPGFTYHVYRLDPTTYRLTELASTAANGWKGLALDGSGSILYEDASGHLMAQRPDGAPFQLAATLPAGFTLTMSGAAALAPDNTAYLRYQANQVYQCANGQLRPVAGNLIDSGNGSLALAAPCGVAVGADGGYYVADRDRNQILHYDATAKGAVFAGTGTAGYAADGTTAANATLGAPTAVRLDGAGNVYFVEEAPAVAANFNQVNALCVTTGDPLSRVRMIGADGKLSTVYTAPKHLIEDLAVGTDGTIYVTEWDPCSQLAGHVVQQAPGGQPSELATEPVGWGEGASICVDTAGNVYLADGLLHKLVGGTVQDLSPRPFRGSIGCDGVGKVYLVNDNTVTRYSPNTGGFELLAGPGALNLSGTDVNGSLRNARCPAFGPDGTLFIADTDHKQVKKLAPNAIMLGIPL